MFELRQQAQQASTAEDAQNGIKMIEPGFGIEEEIGEGGIRRHNNSG
ncbi:MAG: hypothetical protein ONB44_11200 [candidate division KSB1 bacterium]|nr:hypothetical protein [candidate division KSB1 bacterium]MDZ7302689.1 hypothetical protein [candidate division KSB1 bacterium]MDZ7311780.1 hypothetical protein [candidate division KSB1 bacterium]